AAAVATTSTAKNIMVISSTMDSDAIHSSESNSPFLAKSGDTFDSWQTPSTPALLRRDGRAALTILSPERREVMRPYLAVDGTARVVEGGAPELLRELAATLASPKVGFRRRVPHPGS